MIDAQPNLPRREGLVEKIIEFSARNKFIVLIFVAVMMFGALWSVKNIPLDAIPDLSDTQVIIYSRWDRSPDIIEDQVTYPIISALLGASQVKAIRGFSDFGFSYVYVIFKDGTDIYWARSRVLEYLNKISARLPDGVKTELGPDATGVGWVLQYALVDESGEHDLQKLRSYQDWYLRYHLQGVPGVAEVASIGGFEKQYQITVDPNKLYEYKISLQTVIDAVRNSNKEVGGRTIEFSGLEYMVRGRGYATSISDFENTVVGLSDGQPILLKHVAVIEIGPQIRRGISDLDGKGDAVGGTVVMRFGENALNVIARVKEKMKEVEPSLPEGVKIDIVYDRSDLILRAIDNLKHQLIEEMIVVSLVIIIFLWHFPSAIVPIITIPVAILLSFIPLKEMHLTSNIMSLAGIAISIGVLVDGAIIEVENAYKRLQQWIADGKKGDYHDVLLRSLKEVGPSIFFSLLVIAVAFLPIFTLIDQEGRLFKPLAWSKTLAMAMAALLAITLNPAMRMIFTRMKPFEWKSRWASKAATSILVGKYYPEEQHPISKRLYRVYEPVCRFVLRHAKATIVAAVLVVLTTIPVFMKLGSEFMPPLWEGSILYMPTTMPGISVTEAQKLLQTQDQILKNFLEVEKVFGKAGRIESSTDPAPFSMMETVVLLKPQNEWSPKNRWYSDFPEVFQKPFRSIWPDRISPEELISEMDSIIKIPGTTNAWTMPIKNRIDMLTTGVRTPVGIKILGDDLAVIESIGTKIESILRDVSGTRSVFAERAVGGYFLDFDLNRSKLARYGLSVNDAQETIMAAIGGEEITTTIEGRERYSVNVRYPRELRDSADDLENVLISTPSGEQIRLGQMADIVFRSGPAMIRNENGLRAGYVYVDVAGRDIGSYVTEAKKIIHEQLTLPQGYALNFSGQYENMIRVKERLKVVIPLTLFIIFLLLYINTKSVARTMIVLLAVPFSLVGAVWLLWILDYNMSIAVWVGMIALMGLDAETGVFMLLYLDLCYEDAKRKGKMVTKKDLEEAIVEGAVKRLRPKLMTVATAFIGLLPIMWSTGAGADLMKRIAAPMVGGLFSSFILELLVYPVVYFLWKWHTEVNKVSVKKIVLENASPI